MARFIFIALVCLLPTTATAQEILPWPGVHPTTDTEQFKLYADNLKLGCAATTESGQEREQCTQLAQALMDVYSLVNFDEVSWILGVGQGKVTEREELNKRTRLREFVDIKRKFIHDYPRAAAFVENKRANDT